MAGRGGGIYAHHHARRAAKQAAMTPEQKELSRQREKLRLLAPVACAPTVGDPFAIDWFAAPEHNCGYQPRTGANGKALPKSGPNAEPAWRWTEEPARGRGASMRAHVNDLAVKVYRLGHRHSTVELQDGDGFPDDLFWGPGGLIVRELKKMKHEWKPGQKPHLLSMRESGLDVGVWFPCCILSGHVDEQLAQLAGREPCGPYARSRRGVPNPTNPTWRDVADGALSA